MRTSSGRGDVGSEIIFSSRGAGVTSGRGVRGERWGRTKQTNENDRRIGQIYPIKEALEGHFATGNGYTNTNEINIVTVIASPEGVAISFLLGLLRRSASRNDP